MDVNIRMKCQVYKVHSGLYKKLTGIKSYIMTAPAVASIYEEEGNYC